MPSPGMTAILISRPWGWLIVLAPPVVTQSFRGGSECTGSAGGGRRLHPARRDGRPEHAGSTGHPRRRHDRDVRLLRDGRGYAVRPDRGDHAVLAGEGLDARSWQG